jgi:hypothetical protein
MNENIVGKIYIFTNPSFPDYVKIGYSKNVENRLNQLNNSEAVPFAFRLYATYEVETQSADKVLHKIIDKLNADLRSVDTINDKVRVREFYLITPEDAYELLEDIAIISGTKERLHLYKPTKNEVQEEETAKKNRELAKNRHHFKDINFKSSLTNKIYYSKTKEDGTLGIYEEDTNNEVPNNSNPSKKQILLQAVKDLNGEVESSITLYQLQHKLEKLLNK